MRRIVERGENNQQKCLQHRWHGGEEGTYLLDTLQYAVFGRVVGVILCWDLKESRECLRIPVDDGADLLGDVLIDQEDGDVLTFSGEVVEGLFDVRYRSLL